MLRRWRGRGYALVRTYEMHKQANAFLFEMNPRGTAVVAVSKGFKSIL